MLIFTEGLSSNPYHHAQSAMKDDTKCPMEPKTAPCDMGYCLEANGWNKCPAIKHICVEGCPACVFENILSKCIEVDLNNVYAKYQVYMKQQTPYDQCMTFEEFFEQFIQQEERKSAICTRPFFEMPVCTSCLPDNICLSKDRCEFKQDEKGKDVK
jgi:hypothetical protein